jgi:Cof subfamily protein (haloacid dehalogenase superfamily)
MNYRLLAIDLDGTLLNSRHELSPENRAALHRAHAAGLKIVLCTGRSYTETRPIVAEIGLDLDAAVSVFGALVSEVRTGRTLLRTPFEPAVARAATAWFQGHGYPVLWLLDPEQVGFDGYLFPGPRRHAALDRWLDLTPCRIREETGPPEEHGDVVRVTVVDDPASLARVSAEFSAAFGARVGHNVLSAPSYRVTLIESFAPQVNKWYGIAQLCQRWEIAPEQTVAVGDDVNDVAMLRRAGLGVAVANAKPAARAAARRTTASNDEHGVARLIDELLAG